MTDSKGFRINAFTLFTHIYGHAPSPYPSSSRTPPLFVALKGPQGSGKTSLAKRVEEMLAENNEDHAPIRAVTIDDLYLPHDQLKTLAAAHPYNPFLCGRGLPGTHDIALGLALQVLQSLKEINHTPSNDIRIPRFDKSLFNGEGDRLPESEWTAVPGRIDVVLLEDAISRYYFPTRTFTYALRSPSELLHHVSSFLTWHLQ